MGHKILWHPAKFIDERTKKDFARDGYWFSLWSSIIVGLTVILLSLIFTKSGYYVEELTIKKGIVIFLVSFSVYYLLNILSAFLTREIVGMLKKDILFYKALAAVSYPYFLLSVGFALMTIFAIFPGINILTPIIGIIFIARSYGIYIRFLHEYAKLDNIEAYVASVILISALTFGFIIGVNILSAVPGNVFGM